MPLNPQSSLTRLFNAPVRSGVLIWIGVRPERRLAMCPVDEAILDPHVGMEGDHYSRDAGYGKSRSSRPRVSRLSQVTLEWKRSHQRSCVAI